MSFYRWHSAPPQDYNSHDPLEAAYVWSGPYTSNNHYRIAFAHNTTLSPAVRFDICCQILSFFKSAMNIVQNSRAWFLRQPYTEHLCVPFCFPYFNLSRNYKTAFLFMKWLFNFLRNLWQRSLFAMFSNWKETKTPMNFRGLYIIGAKHQEMVTQCDEYLLVASGRTCEYMWWRLYMDDAFVIWEDDKDFLISFFQ